MPSPNDEPLIYTCKGNLPAASLRYVCDWQLIGPDGSLAWCYSSGLPMPPVDGMNAMVFVEEHYLGDEQVKRSVHALRLTGLTTGVQTGQLGG